MSFLPHDCRAAVAQWSRYLIMAAALLIGYRLSLDNAHSIASSQSTSSTHVIEDETFNDKDINNNLIDYDDGQEPDSESR
ncbi:hypothetical protein TNCV_1590541 [Trichonephila clavipes]|nr:hypothetical protein TNCV_1590541 [Trichonephila clavipes]